MSAEDVRQRIQRVEGSGMRTFTSPEPLVWARTAGTSVWDEDGREYLDLYAGFAAAAVGYCHPRVTEAITRQAGIMTHCPSAAPSEVRAEFYEKLLAIAPSGLTRVMPALGGAQANEMAIHLAKAATGRRGVIAFSGAYLGRTVGSVIYAGKRAYREPFGLDAGAQFVPFPDPYRSPWAGDDEPGARAIALVESYLMDPASGVDLPACIMVEPIQGNGGIVIPPPGFLAGLRRIADEVGALLIFDEIQCGFGRSGKIWAGEHDGVVPDLMTVGKGIGGGLSLAAVLGREGPMMSWKPDSVTATFVANALPEAAAIAAIDVFCERDLAGRSARLGAHTLEVLKRKLDGAREVGNVRGRGLFIGIEMVDGAGVPAPDTATKMARRLREEGVIVGVGGRFGSVLKISPALVIEEADLERGIAAIVEILQ